MSKLTLDALKSKAEAVASNELLTTISGGTENDCHPCEECAQLKVTTQDSWQGGTYGYYHLIFH